MQTSKSQGLTDMRRHHPEWCLGDDAPNWCTTSWNMAIPEVREHKLDLIEQSCRLADWDGVELDWQRHAFHLPGKHEYPDALRPDRSPAGDSPDDRHPRRRARATVPGCREGRRYVGGVQEHRLHVETWVNEGLCDIIIGGGNSGTDPCFETEEFLSLVEGTNILVYPGYDFDSRQAADRLIPHSEWRDRWFAAMSQGPLRAWRARNVRLQLARERDHPPRDAHVNRLARHAATKETRPTRPYREASPTTRSARTPSATTGSTARCR